MATRQGDPLIDLVLARNLAAAKAGGNAPAKGTPERTQMEAAAKRVGWARAEKTIKATSQADDDLSFAIRVRRAFAPVASEQVMKSAPTAAVAGAVKSAAATRAATRAELERTLPPKLVKQLEAGALEDADPCQACGGSGLAPEVTDAHGIGTNSRPCGACGGLGLAESTSDDDEVAKVLIGIRRMKALAKAVSKSIKKADAKAIAEAGHVVSVGVSSKELANATPRERRAFDRQLAKELDLDPAKVAAKCMSAKALGEAQ